MTSISTHKYFHQTSISNAIDLVVVSDSAVKREVFIQGGKIHILTKLTLYKEQLSRPCKYHESFNKTMGDNRFQRTYYLWRGHSGKSGLHFGEQKVLMDHWNFSFPFGQSYVFEHKAP